MFYMFVGKDILIGSETLILLISLLHFFERQGNYSGFIERRKLLVKLCSCGSLGVNPGEGNWISEYPILILSFRSENITKLL